MVINKYIYFMEAVMPAKKQVTKEMLLSAALALLREGGAEAVSVKALAGRLNCSTQPVYLSFSGMDALRGELSALAVRELLEAVGYGRKEATLYGMDYIRFAVREKNLFRFLFMRRNAYEELKESLRPILEDSIGRLMERYHIGREEAHHFHDQLWMHAHGIASMAATGFCEWNMDKVARMLAECEQYLGRKYEV